MAHRFPLIPYAAYGPDPDPLPVREAGDSGGPEYVVTASLQQEHRRGVTLLGTTQTGKAARIAVNIVAPGIAHVVLEDAATDVQRITLARKPAGRRPPVSIEKTANQVSLVSDQVTVRIALDPFRMSFYGPGERHLLEQNCTDTVARGQLIVLPFGFSSDGGSRVAFHDAFTIEPDEHFYGRNYQVNQG